MSLWTHVSGIIRIDDFRVMDTPLPDFDSILGKELNYEDDFEEFYEHPELYMPGGDEGTLHKSVWVNPTKHSMAAYAVSIFGDLRDGDSPNEIIEWFKKICDKVNPRQAVITAHYGDPKTAVTWVYGSESTRKDKGDYIC